MVGLSIVLESHQKSSSSSSVTNSSVNKKIAPQVINKTTMIINKPSTSCSSSSSSSSANPFLFSSYRTNLHCSSSSSLQLLPFLEHCFLCGQKLLPGKDIYMYKGDRGFCSVECRYRQIFMDEEDSLRKENCSLAAMKPTSSASSSSSSSNSNSASSSRHHRKRTRNRAGGFAY